MHRIQRRETDIRERKTFQRCKEYIRDSFYKEGEQAEGPEILKSEVEPTLANLNRNKAAGTDGIVTEMLVNISNISIMHMSIYIFSF